MRLLHATYFPISGNGNNVFKPAAHTIQNFPVKDVTAMELFFGAIDQGGLHVFWQHWMSV
jgi:hypothetical protein